MRTIRPPALQLSKRLAATLALACVCALASGAPDPASAAGEFPGGGLAALLDGELVPFPVLKTDMRARLQGDLATVRVTQVFENPYTDPMHARYVFPLPSDAAVFAMRMLSGEHMIEAEIRRKPEARAIFEAAKERGNQGALLGQERPNVFTQEVANLLPGAPVRVELEYAHVVPKASGDYRFHFPMVVGPRYVPEPPPGGDPGAPTHEPGEPEGVEAGVWKLPASAPVAPPARVDRERVSIRVQLEAGFPIQWVESPSHPIAVKRVSAGVREIELAGGRTLDNSDFILLYRLASDTVAAGSTTSAEGDEGFVSLLLEPPRDLPDAEITPRELVFVLDCSGSMSGVPLAASKRFMRRTLPRLRPGDSFRIVRFSDAATEWSSSPMPATPENIRSGLRYIDSLYGGGGTVMTSGIRAALAPPVPEGALRLVVFLTDGYIGNDVEIVRLIQARRGQARFFSFGIGTSVNRYLIREMARVGRGAARVVLPDEDADRAADQLAERLESPVLTDVEIDWGEAPVRDVFPRRIPDLFLGQSVRVMGRYRTREGGDRSHRVVVRGRIAGRPAELPLDVYLPSESDGSEGAALPILWARAQVEDRMTSYLDPARSAAEREELQEEVTQLGLAHRLVTRWTSFVAVARPVVNPGGRGIHADVAVPQVKGVSEAAYPPSALPGEAKAPLGPPLQAVAGLATGEFQGSAAPEPETWVALAVLAAVSGLWLRRGRGSDTKRRRSGW